ncbi:MAG: cupin domain-containing protein [Gemmatimonadota bacterium]|jgi:mannose-6-phosphate isomerase-like protein (cupin superfamily)
MTRELRRIITGHDESGKSVVLAEKPPSEYGKLHSMWVTDGSPASYAQEDAVEGRRVKLEPPPYGSHFLFFRVEPDDPALDAAEIEAQVAQGFERIGAAHCRPDTSKNVHMHETGTIDYVIVLEGEVTLLLDEDEVDLKPFDVVIQRGTNHAWIAKNGQRALLAAILVDAEPRA